jgi:(1->4)-alpha-D-glucan 1-alpha-D-glucosylmutase
LNADELLERLTAEPGRVLRIPAATYRLQLGPELTFGDAAALVPYLDALGITDCYTSPFLETATPGSHGYDVSDHNRLRLELGGEVEFRRFARALSEHSLGLLIDVVPNHMGIAGNRNAWWSDVLENGPSSVYASYFDIDWRPIKPELAGKVLLPILGDQYGAVLERGELRLEYLEGAFWIRYYETLLPVGPGSYPRILGHQIERLQQAVGPEHQALLELQSIITAYLKLPAGDEKDPARIAERQREKEIGKRRLAALTKDSTEVREFIEETVRQFNGTPGSARSFDLLDGLLDQQAYRLASWRVAGDEINYRRFFDINELAAIRMEDPAVFEQTHRLIFRLIREGIVTGLRIDHPDGLYAPTQYLARLQRGCFLEAARRLAGDLASADFAPETRSPREAKWVPEAKLAPAGKGEWEEQLLARYDARIPPPAFYVVAEKILVGTEPLPETWPIHGTTGYEFLATVNALLVDRTQERAITAAHARFAGTDETFGQVTYESKKLILETSMASEVNLLAHRLSRLAERDRFSRDFTRRSLTYALREIIASFPVYRTYIGESGDDARERDGAYIAQAIAWARRRNPTRDSSIFDWIHDILRGRVPNHLGEADRQARTDWVMRFQQMTGPVTAKGVEDTALYRYTRFPSLNEVGSEPDRFGVSAEAFHVFAGRRQQQWPASLSATATHDSKWSDDVRARIDVLSEMPQEWRARTRRWRRLNSRHRPQLDGRPVPDPNEEYLLYHAMLGAWPIDRDRLRQYFLKAMKEAKRYTSWTNPNPEREAAALGFVDAILDPARSAAFLSDLQAFRGRVAPYGFFNSLTQTLIRLTAPGVPDTYQGSELWSFNLVDPDNRRPVDWALRRRLLEELQAASAADLGRLARSLVDAMEDGRIKLFLTWRALTFRRRHREWFATGDYRPLEVRGSLAEHVLAFSRGAGAVVVVVPRLLARRGVTGPPLGPSVWQNTTLAPAPVPMGTRLRNVFTGDTVVAGEAGLALAEVLASFPVALLAVEGRT